MSLHAAADKSKRACLHALAARPRTVHTPRHTDVLTKMPCFVTPYHYRLDWETWIHVTAMGEHSAPSTPAYISRLISRLLRGDLEVK